MLGVKSWVQAEQRQLLGAHPRMNKQQLGRKPSKQDAHDPRISLDRRSWPDTAASLYRIPNLMPNPQRLCVDTLQRAFEQPFGSNQAE